MDWVAIAVKETFDSIAKAQRRNAELETKLLNKDKNTLEDWDDFEEDEDDNINT